MKGSMPYHRQWLILGERSSKTNTGRTAPIPSFQIDAGSTGKVPDTELAPGHLNQILLENLVGAVRASRPHPSKPM
jgi:hypothetical protein